MREESEERAVEIEKVRELARRKMCWKGNSEGKNRGRVRLKKSVI